MLISQWARKARDIGDVIIDPVLTDVNLLSWFTIIMWGLLFIQCSKYVTIVILPVNLSRDFVRLIFPSTKAYMVHVQWFLKTRCYFMYLKHNSEILQWKILTVSGESNKWQFFKNCDTKQWYNYTCIYCIVITLMNDSEASVKFIVIFPLLFCTCTEDDVNNYTLPTHTWFANYMLTWEHCEPV